MKVRVLTLVMIAGMFFSAGVFAQDDFTVNMSTYTEFYNQKNYRMHIRLGNGASKIVTTRLAKRPPRIFSYRVPQS
jgi:outer membrane lipoprotein-sorting protein